MMKYLIVGLGNMGEDYECTRHNIGFDILEALAATASAKAVFGQVRHADLFKFKTKGRTVILLKPSTFVNLSGKAVGFWMQKEKIRIENLLVVTDDIALPFGTLRLRAKGNDGGHNGLKNIDTVLGTNKYARLRFGIGGEFQRGSQVNYVLGTWSDSEQPLLAERIEMAGKMILSFCILGVDKTMSEFNNRQK